MFVDDSAYWRRIVRTMLHGFGAREIYEAENGAQGWDMFIQHGPDILIADLMMPGFDGIDLTKMIRQPGGNPNPHTPIILLTCYTQRSRVIAARDAGITEFLAKPVSARSLYDRIANIVCNPHPFVKTDSYFGAELRQNETVLL